MEHDPGKIRPAAGLGGRLLTFAGAGELSALAEAVIALVCAPTVDGPRYGEVLDWVVTTTAEVIATKLGPSGGSIADCTIKIGTPDGRTLESGELPAPECHLWTAIVDALAGNPRRAHHHLAAAVEATGRDGQILALIEAVIWLDRLLNIPASSGLDTAPG